MDGAFKDLDLPPFVAIMNLRLPVLVDLVPRLGWCLCAEGRYSTVMAGNFANEYGTREYCE